VDYSGLQARAALLTSLEGWTDVANPPDWTILVNQAWLQFSWDSEYLIGTTTVTTAPGTMSYILPGGQQWKRLLDVVWDSAGTPQPVDRSTEDYERFLSGDWRTQSSGVPLRFTFNTPNTISLIPPPNAVKSVLVRGIAQGSAMALSTDLPGQVSGVGTAIPDVFHEAIAEYAAWLWAQSYYRGDATARMQGWLSYYQGQVQDAKNHADPQKENR